LLRLAEDRTGWQAQGVREYNTLKYEVFGRARLPPSRDLVKKLRFTRRFALPIPGHPVASSKWDPRRNRRI
jgi:hypothetical protein